MKEKIKKFHNFLKQDSFASWVVSLILALVIVKFIFFPFLSLVLATEMPLVVVESQSMHHPGTFIGNTIGLKSSFEIWWNQAKSWYEKNGIKKEQAENWDFRTGIEMGDIVIVSGRGRPEVGDVIIFNANQRYPIIHRIVKIETINNETVYSTKGDNNLEQIYFEKNIPQDAVIGKAVFKIPKLGWIKLVFVKLFTLSK